MTLKSRANILSVTDFWETASRRKLVAYTAAFDQDTQRLLTMPVGGAAAANPNQPFTLKDINAAAMTGWMRPFDIWVWVATVGYFIIGALICWAVEGSAGNEDYLVDGTMSGLSAVQSVWGGVLDFFLGGPSVLTAVTWPGRFCLFGYTLFIFITVSMVCLCSSFSYSGTCGTCGTANNGSTVPPSVWSVFSLHFHQRLYGPYMSSPHGWNDKPAGGLIKNQTTLAPLVTYDHLSLMTYHS